MHATFQDARYLYILLEAAMGGELYSVLERQGTVHPVAAKFYSGCLVSVFEHLHQRRIVRHPAAATPDRQRQSRPALPLTPSGRVWVQVYRDLKPENVLIDAQGYPKLIDFGFGKVRHPRCSPSPPAADRPSPRPRCL